jgi:hypothetical protein
MVIVTSPARNVTGLLLEPVAARGWGDMKLALVMAFVGALLVVSLVAASTPAAAVLRTGLPNHALTPGAFDPNVTQATIRTTICA